jgi:hypothetical protein
LLEALGHMQPAGAEERSHALAEQPSITASLKQNSLRRTRGVLRGYRRGMTA